jgi:biotin carboxylase
VRSSPMPDLATFDLVNNKWNFTRFAREHGVRVPQSWLYDTVDELRAALRSGSLALPITAKPISQSASRGVFNIRNDGELSQLDAIDYRPILVQRHIFGEMISTSLIARSGRILAYATQYRDEQWFQLRVNPDFFQNVERFVTASNLSGPGNFDAICEEGSGLTYIIECNARFWYTMYMSMVVGLNFLDFALHEAAARPDHVATLGDGEMRLSPRAILASLWHANRHEWKLVAHHMSDPLAYVAKRKRLFNDTSVGIRPEQMRTFTPAELAGMVRPSRRLVA